MHSDVYTIKLNLIPAPETGKQMSWVVNITKKKLFSIYFVFQSVPEVTVRLIVIANIILNPPLVYLWKGSSVQFKVELLKQGKNQGISNLIIDNLCKAMHVFDVT